jgi:hypothetical protein
MDSVFRAVSTASEGDTDTQTDTDTVSTSSRGAGEMASRPSFTRSYSTGAHTFTSPCPQISTLGSHRAFLTYSHPGNSPFLHISPLVQVWLDWGTQRAFFTQTRAAILGGKKSSQSYPWQCCLGECHSTLYVLHYIFVMSVCARGHSTSCFST